MPRRHVFGALLVALVWGANFVVIHVGLEHFPPLLFAALRFALVLPALPFVPRPGAPVRWVFAVGAFLSAGQFGLLFLGMDQGMPAGLASVVVQLQAAFTVLLAVALLGERLRPAQLAGGLLAFAGIGILAAGRADGVPLGAVALCIAGAGSWAIGNVCTRLSGSPHPLGLLVWSSLVPPLPLLALSLATEGPDAAADAVTGLDPAGLFAIAYVVVLATFVGYGIWTFLLQRHPASQVAPFSLLVPVVGIVCAWIALGERPGAAELAGAAVVLAGLGLTVVRRRPSGVAAASGAAPARRIGPPPRTRPAARR
jgi:O-acetylserine/cysteine efflux transporter